MGKGCLVYMPGDLKSRLKYGLLIAESVAIFAVMVAMLTAGNAYESNLKSKQEQLNDLVRQYNSRSESLESAGLDSSQVEVQMTSAKSAGDAVSGLQNRLLELFYTERTTREQEDADYEAMNAVQTDLEKYFGDNATMRSIWYSGDVKNIGNGKWQFESNYNYAGGVVPVLWTLSSGSDVEEQSGAVLAYVTANYHADTDTFSDAARYVTYVGNSFYGFTNDQEFEIDEETDFDSDAYADSIISIMDSVDDAISDEERQVIDDYIKNSQDFRADREEAVESLKKAAMGGE